MDSLENAYKTLANAKREEQELVLRKEKLMKIDDILFGDIIDYVFPRCQTISEKVHIIERENSREKFRIYLIFLVYFLGFAVIDLLSIFSHGSIGVIPWSVILGSACFGLHSSKHFSTISQNNKIIESLEYAQEALNNDPKYKGRTLQEVLLLMDSEKAMLRIEIDDKREAIQEYEANLNDANRELAEEILVSSGIEASVTLNSSMKVLAKRYEQKKETEN